MKNKFTVFFLLLIPSAIFGQISNSWDGLGINPNSKFRILNIFINVIYDVYPVYNTVPPSPYWEQATVEGVNNEAIPTYLLDFLDTAYHSGNLHGSMTRLYSESSFDSLQITGDFVVVNVNESSVLNNYSYFNYTNLIKTAINIINQDGLRTLYHHDSIYDYDFLNNTKVFFTQFIIRNTTKAYGNIAIGEGIGNHIINSSIRIGNQYYFFSKASVQCVGSHNISYNVADVVYHELSHSLFGSNAFHTSGGNHRGSQEYMPFFTTQGGFGLMGQSGKSLFSCNGYERWRMHWKHPDAPDYITARNMDNTAYQISDIRKEDGNKSFLLRDFVTYGDAIRIKLPYKDSEAASNQYIWLENHKVGLNDKLDFFQYSNSTDCRPQGSAGIYAYYQVGRDILSGSESEVWFANERDNLKIIPAEGYWNYSVNIDPNNPYNMQCVNWQDHTYYHSREEANPFCGYQDQETQFFPKITDQMINLSQEYCMWRKKIGNDINDSLACIGDNRDAFSGYRKINMSTNPSTCNAKTYYNYIYESGAYDFTSQIHRNNQTTYLTGLSIEMIPQANNDFMVHIRWDDYDIVNDANWTGKIALKEKANLTNGNNILLTQNLTLAQPHRDIVSNVFAPTTVLSCESGAEFTLQAQSSIILEEKSKLVLKSGSTFIINDESDVYIQEGCTFEMEKCAKLIIKSSGTLHINENAIFVVHPGAIIQLDDINNILLPINANFSTEDGLTFTSVLELLDVLGIVTNYSINDNVLWNGDNMLLTQVLTIESGAELTIQNTVRCIEDVNIVINPGGKLIIDGGTLTNACEGELWGGIEVHGTPTSSQNAPWSDQGVVILQNDAVIENAVCGIRIGKEINIPVDLNGTIITIPEDFDEPLSMSIYGGGIVIAENASFVNNKQAVNFQSYIYINSLNNEIDNISEFINCHFTVNNDALFTVKDYESQVYLHGVKGVSFKGCTFSDIQTKNSLDDYGIGIYANTAGFRINNNRAMYDLIPYEPTTSYFSGYGTAIRIQNAQSMPARIYNTEFTNNHVSVNAKASYALCLQMCNIYNSHRGHASSLYGLILNECDNYSVANNMFHGDGTGIHLTGDVISNNRINNNTFYQMCLAINVDGVQGNEINEVPNIGLKILCNLFDNNEEDIRIAENGRISMLQGAFIASNGVYLGTGNQFGSSITSPININNRNDNAFIGYYYNQSGLNHLPLYNYNPPINLLIAPVNDDKCLNVGYMGNDYYTLEITTLNELNDMYLDKYQEYEDLLQTYQETFDTYSIQQIIETIGLPYYAGMSIQFDAFAELSELKDNLSTICQDAIQLLLTGEETDKNLFNSWLYRCQTVEADYVVAQNYLNEGNLSQMNNVLNNVLIKYPTGNIFENNQYKACLNYVGSWVIDPENLVISQNAIDSLEYIASGNANISFVAESILEKIGKKPLIIDEIDRCNWYVIINSNYDDMDQTSENEYSEIEQQDILLLPNPTDNELTVDNHSLDIKEISIYDMLGKEIKRFTVNQSKVTLPLNNICPGIYTIKVYTSKGIQIKKFVKK